MKVNHTDGIELFVQKDEHTFSMLYDQYAAILYGIILRKVDNVSMAENLLHQSFATIWSEIHTYDSTKDRLLLWLIQKTASTTHQFFKSKENSSNAGTVEEIIQEPISSSSYSTVPL